MIASKNYNFISSMDATKGEEKKLNNEKKRIKRQNEGATDNAVGGSTRYIRKYKKSKKVENIRRNIIQKDSSAIMPEFFKSCTSFLSTSKMKNYENDDNSYNNDAMNDYNNDMGDYNNDKND
ncbi:hypothetical protein PMALA_055750 [Plasmodium malariae]|nr:hypothetical protein PMALA_055750 [Plasmodium malariae]